MHKLYARSEIPSNQAPIYDRIMGGIYFIKGVLYE